MARRKRFISDWGPGMGIRVRGCSSQGGAVLLARGEKGPSLRRYGGRIGPALRGRDVGTFPRGCRVGTGWWFLSVCAMGVKLLHEGACGLCPAEDGAAAGVFRMRQVGFSCFSPLLLTGR